MAAFNSHTNFSIPISDLSQGRDVPRYVPVFVNIGSFFMFSVGAYLCLRVCHVKQRRDHRY